jgi:hypothetical protein
MHPIWQAMQVITIDGERHINHCNNFGNRGAGGLWGTFMGLVIWIATVVKFIEDLLAYVDDTYSWGFADNLTWYEPYRKFLPSKQVSLLLLWDEIGVPHEEDKQVFGETLTIIGMDVNPNAMTITMPQIACNDLVLALRDFSRPNQRWTLREFQRLAGWMNWALNAYPLLCPGLSVLYEKMSGISNTHILIQVSVALCKELLETMINEC